MSQDNRTLLRQIMAIAKEAGDGIVSIYNRQQPLEIHNKSDDTPLTAADLAAHRLICNSLKRLTPDIPVLSEESSDEERRGHQGWQRYWLVDPLDGTKEFIKRNGEFTVNIALIEEGRPVLGAVHVPISGSGYGGCVRSGAIKRPLKGREKPIHARPLAPFKPITLVVSRSHPDPRLQPVIAQLEKTTPVSTTAIGSSLKLCLIAEGLADLHLRFGRTCEWDTAAAQAVLEAAGGQVMDLNLAPLRYNRKEDLFNPEFIAVGDPSQPWGSTLQLADFI